MATGGGCVFLGQHRYVVFFFSENLKADGQVCDLFLPQVLVPGSIHNAFLDNLIPDTEYSVTVVPVYVDGDGPSGEDKGKTCGSTCH